MALCGLPRIYRERFARTSALTAQLQSGASDLQFTSAYRRSVSVQPLCPRNTWPLVPSCKSSDGVTVSDVDGNVLYDVANSYGVNLFGYDFYKDCIARGAERVRDLGPVLGAYHPIVAYNIERIRQISGLDEVSFHMSGTEAVMQAVRLARYHTRRSHIVRFCGAYHGWWSDVQPGIGNLRPCARPTRWQKCPSDTLHVLRTRRDIACVLVNPLQALHPNAPRQPIRRWSTAAGRRISIAQAYTRWLQQLRRCAPNARSP